MVEILLINKGFEQNLLRSPLKWTPEEHTTLINLTIPARQPEFLYENIWTIRNKESALRNL